jgi:Fe2+ transport system protein B
MLFDGESRTAIYKVARSIVNDGKPYDNPITSILGFVVYATLTVVGLALLALIEGLPSLLAGTSYEWIKTAIDTNHFWYTMYIIISLIATVIIVAPIVFLFNLIVNFLDEHSWLYVVMFVVLGFILLTRID